MGIENTHPVVSELWQALQQLDDLLAAAVAAAQAVYGPHAASDPYRGLLIRQDEVGQLLDREPGGPLFWKEGPKLRQQQSRLPLLFDHAILGFENLKS